MHYVIIKVERLYDSIHNAEKVSDKNRYEFTQKNLILETSKTWALSLIYFFRKLRLCLWLNGSIFIVVRKREEFSL